VSSNWNLMSVEDLQDSITMLLDSKNRTILSAVTPYTTMIAEDATRNNTNNDNNPNFKKYPGSMIFHPIMDNFDSNSNIVAVLAIVLDWRLFLEGLLSTTTQNIHIELNNTCSQSYLYL
jgi:hypothetical protein